MLQIWYSPAQLVNQFRAVQGLLGVVQRVHLWNACVCSNGEHLASVGVASVGVAVTYNIVLGLNV